MTKLEAEIILALANNQLNTTEAARKLFMHRTTVNYHIQKIHKHTGKNPLDFFDMCELLPKARRIFADETIVTERTWKAIIEMGRKAHTKEDNND